MTANEPPSISEREPWVNPDGSTNVDGWLTAYADDDNNFWRTDQGHIMNVVDELIERLADTGPRSDVQDQHARTTSEHEVAGPTDARQPTNPPQQAAVQGEPAQAEAGPLTITVHLPQHFGKVTALLDTISRQWPGTILDGDRIEIPSE